MSMLRTLAKVKRHSAMGKICRREAGEPRRIFSEEWLELVDNAACFPAAGMFRLRAKYSFIFSGLWYSRRKTPALMLFISSWRWWFLLFSRISATFLLIVRGVSRDLKGRADTDVI